MNIKKAFSIIFLLMIFSFLLNSSFGYVECELIEGKQVVFDNGVCEKVDLELDIGEEVELNLNGGVFLIKYLGSKLIDNTNRDVDKETLPYIEKGEEYDYSKYYLSNFYELNGVKTNRVFESIQRSEQSVWMGFFDSPMEEDNRKPDKPNNRKYLGKIQFRASELRYSADCEGYYKDDLETEYYKVVTFNKGWNLVPRKLNVYSCRGNNNLLCKDYAKVFNFDPITKEYHTNSFVERYEDYYNSTRNGGDLYFRNFRINLNNIMIEKFGSNYNKKTSKIKFENYSFIPSFFRSGDSILNTIDPGNELSQLTKDAMWIYLDNETDKYLASSLYFNFNPVFGIPIFKGWSVQYVFPEMVFVNERIEGKSSMSLNKIKGDCEIEKAYFFNSLTQSWEEFSLDYEFNEDDIYRGYALSVKEDCRFGMKSKEKIKIFSDETEGEVRSRFKENIFGEMTTECSSSNDEDMCLTMYECYSGNIADSFSRNSMLYYFYIKEGKTFMDAFRELEEYDEDLDFDTIFDEAEDSCIEELYNGGEK